MAKEIVTTDNAPKSTAIQEQTAQCLKNIDAILQAAGSSLEKIVSATFILGDPNDFAGMNEEWVKWFPKDLPARQGAKLPIQPKGMKISIAVIAEAQSFYKYIAPQPDYLISVLG